MATAHFTYRSTFRTRLCAALVCALLVLSARAAEVTEGASAADIRLLVDVSGSMNQSDPQNLRGEGLALLAKMLPTDTRAGLWSFAGNVNEIVPSGAVDERWRQRTQDSLQALRSVGQLTDIGAALARAGRAPKSAERGHILLLTDGKVDVHNNADRNRRERDSILTELLPNLIARGFVIHTIALSNDADAELLQAIAAESAGEHRVVTNRDELVSVFVDILDQAVPPQRLPLSGDGFVVDSSVDELTVLIYHADTSEARAHLLDPDLQAVSDERHAPNVRWLSRPRYDLVTIPQPQNGRWQLVNGGPDARVTILTDLTLQVQPHAQALLPGEPLSLSFVLRERGQILTDGALLQNIRAHVNISARDGDGALDEPVEHSVVLRPADASGRFVLHTNAPEAPGQYQLNMRIDGATFAREYQRRFAVESAFTVQLDKQVNQKTVVYQVEVSAVSALNVEQTEVVAHIKDSTGANALMALKRLPAGLWGITVTPERRARYVIELQAKGVDSAGREFSQTLEPQYFTYPAEGDPQPPMADGTLTGLEQALAAEREALARERGVAAPEPVASVVEVASSASSSAASVASVTPVAPESDGTRWWLVVLVALFNIALLGLIYWLYRRFSGKSMESELNELEQQLSDDEAQDETQSSEPELPTGAFDDVFADVEDPASADTNSAAPEPSAATEAIELGDDDPLAALDDLVDIDAPVPAEDDTEADSNNPENHDPASGDAGDGDTANKDKNRP